MADNFKDFSVTDPSGKTYSVHAPADASQEDIFAFVQQNLAKPDAPNPNPVSTPVTENVYVQGNPTVKDEDWLGPDARAQVTAMQNNPKYSYGDIDQYVKSVAKQKGLVEVGLGGTSEQLDAYRKGLAKGNLPQDASYAPFDWGKVLGSEPHPTAPGSSLTPSLDGTAPVGVLTPQEYSQLARGAEEGAQYMGAGFLGRTFADWAGVGNETIDALYPNATPEQRSQLRKSFLAWTQRGIREANAQQTAGDNPLMNFGGQALVPDPIDLVGGIGGGAVKGGTALSRVARRVGEGAALNAGMDAAYQGLDVKAGVQDGYNPMQTLQQAAFGGALHGAIHSAHELGGHGEAGAEAPAPERAAEGTPEGTPEVAPATGIEMPKTRKNAKAYPAQLAKTSEQVADHINNITSKWKNAPKFEVYDHFNDLEGVDPNALGAHGPNGEVIINTSAVIRDAKKAKVSPEEVVSAVTYHEALGHHGLAQRFGDDLENSLTEFYDNGVQTFRDSVDKWMKDNPTAYADRPNRLALATEEVLAEMSEKGQIPVTLKDRISNVVKDYARKMGIDLKYSDREIKTILAMSHDAVINGKGRDVAGNGYKFMNVGPDAQLGIDRLSARIRAMSKDERNVSNSEIFKETGWWKDQDGKWRTRISDRDSGLVLNPLTNRTVIEDRFEFGDHTNLGEVLHHDELYSAYPWLKNISVEPETHPGYFGGYYHNSNKITLNLEEIRQAREDLRSVMLHEIQHAIQQHEGFASGGNPATALKKTLKDHEIFPAAERLRDEHLAEAASLEKKIKDSKAALKAENLNEYPALKDDLKSHIEQMQWKVWALDEAADAINENIHLNDKEALRSDVIHSQHVKNEAYEWLMGEIEARETQLLRSIDKDHIGKVLPGVGTVERKHPDYIRVTHNSDGSASMPGEPVSRPVTDDRFKTEDKNRRRKNDHDNLRDTYRQLNEKGVNPEDVGLPADPELKYMRQFTKEQAAEAAAVSSARDTIKGALDNYKPRFHSWDEAKSAARERVLPPSYVRKAKSVGDLDVRLHQYDTAAAKVDEKLAALHEKIDSGEFTQKDKAAYLETVFSFNEMTARIFDDQATIARALNAMKALSYTKNKLKSLDEILSHYEDGSLSAFADENTFKAFANQIKYLMESGNLEGAHSMTRAVVQPYWWEYLLSFRHNMMLSGLATHAKNAKDNALMVVRELEEHVLAVPGFYARKGLKGVGADVKDGVSPEEVVARLYGIFRSLLDWGTYKNAWDDFRQGQSNRVLNAKTELTHARIPVLSKVSDALHGADTLFRAIHMNANLYTLGVRRARKEGFTSKAAFENGSNYAVSPSADMLHEAKNMTDLALLLDTPSSISAWLESAKSIRPNMSVGVQARVFIANLAFPFFRVTDRLLFQMIRRSPLSFLDKDTRADFIAGGARRDVAIARTLYGSALMFYYWNQAAKGNVVGNGPGDYAKQQALEAGGFKPNSVVEDGKYVDATALNLSFLPDDDHNAVAANVASIREGWEKAKQDNDESAMEYYADAFGHASRALGTVLVSNSFASNLDTYVAPFQKDKADSDLSTASANFLGSQADQWLPAMMRQINQTYVDPIKRDTTGDKSFSDRVKGRLMADIPGMSDNLPAKYDVYGDVVEQGKSVSGLNNYQNIKNDEVSKELQKLEKTTPKAVVRGAPSAFELKGVNPDVYDKGMVHDIDGDSIKLTATAKQEWQRVQGWYLRQMMKQSIASGEWKQATDAQRILIVKDMHKDASSAAKDYMLPKLGLQADDTEDN